MNLSHPIGRLRAIGALEGVSFLALLGVAMPLKYLAGMPMAVKVAGWIHGVLFMILLGVLVDVAQSRNWPVMKSAGIFVAALIPFGPFIIDGKLKAEEMQAHPSESGTPSR